MKHSFKEWFAITRYWSFPVSAMPVIATVAYVCWHYTMPCYWWDTALALLGILLFHAAGNILSDYTDYRCGVDNEKAFAVPQLVFKKFEPKEYLILGTILLAIGIAIGLLLTLRSGWLLLLIGGAGALLTLGYSFLKYRALGDLTIFINFAILPILGTSYVFTHSILWEALVLSLPIGLITVAVLHANNTLDIESDKKAGIKTLAMILGKRVSSLLYIAYMILPFLYIVLFVLLNKLPLFALLCLIAIIPAIKNTQQVARYKTEQQQALIGLDQKTAQLQLVFSLLLTIGLILSTLTSSRC